MSEFVILRCRHLNLIQFWYGFLGLGLIALHLILNWRIVNQSDQLIVSMLFWLSLLGLLRRHQFKLIFSSGGFSTALGTVLITLVCLKSASIFATESAFVRLFPGLATLGMGLLVSGFKLQRYWRESLLIVTFMIPNGLANQLLEQCIGAQVQLRVAQLATFMLHYIGFTVARQGMTISLPNGAVSVEYGCAGGNLAILLWQLSVLLVLLFPIIRLQQYLIPIIVVLITFVLSSVRVVIMALVVSNSNAFNYWHGQAGGQIFTTLGIVIFSLYGWWLVDTQTEALTAP